MARGVNESGRSRSHRGDSPWRSPFCTTSLHRAPNNSRRATRSPNAHSAIRHRPTRAELSRTSPTNLSRHRPLRPQHSPDGPQPHTLCTPPSLYAPCPTPTETRQLKRDPCASPLRPSRNPAPTSLRHPRSPPNTSSTRCCDFGPASRKRPRKIHACGSRSTRDRITTPLRVSPNHRSGTQLRQLSQPSLDTSCRSSAGRYNSRLPTDSDAWHGPLLRFGRASRYTRVRDHRTGWCQHGSGPDSAPRDRSPQAPTHPKAPARPVHPAPRSPPTPAAPTSQAPHSPVAQW